MLGFFQYGYSLGVINAPQKVSAEPGCRVRSPGSPGAFPFPGGKHPKTQPGGGIDVSRQRFSSLQVIEAHYAHVLGIVPMDRLAPNTSGEDGPIPSTVPSTVPSTIPGTGAWGSTEGMLAPPEDPAASPHVLTMFWSLSVSVFAIGGMVSSFTVGWIGDRLGR